MAVIHVTVRCDAHHNGGVDLKKRKWEARTYCITHLSH